MHSINISIPTETVDRLRELARRERRSPRQQAAVLVITALEREAERTAPRSSASARARRATDTPERVP